MAEEGILLDGHAAFCDIVVPLAGKGIPLVEADICADTELLGFAVINQAVGGDDLQSEVGHLPSPPLNLATTSSMEPAYRK